jgi:nucleoside-diphosphate-sugar epimerase
MRVFITGATGYIGFNVASALRRAGHEVWGLVRSPEKAQTLAKHEIHAVIGSMQQPESYASVAEECAVLIHAAFDMEGNTVALDKTTVETLLNAGKRGAQPKTVIFTSGVWVHGNTAGKLVDETTPLTPAKLVAWRPPHEQMVLSAQGIRGLVIRPGCVYGKQGGLTDMWFSGAYNEKALKVIGDGENRWAMIHVDDLAEAYLRAVESGLSGEVFNLTDRSRSTIREMATAVARATGYTGEIQYIPLSEASQSMGKFAVCLALDQHIDARKAVRLLGWQPKHGGFVDEVDTYFASWKAFQS